MSGLNRRQFAASAMTGALAALAGPQVGAALAAETANGLQLGPTKPFSFELVKQLASELAKSVWAPAVVPNPEILQKIDYDQYQKVKFRPERSLWENGPGQFPVQFFHLGKLFTQPVRLHAVSGGLAQEVIYSANLFEATSDHPARSLPDGIGFAGFRVMSPDLKTDWLAFLGAAYFRTSGPYNQYGLSARALAIDTAMPGPEEFPRFTEFWLEPAGPGRIAIYALMDSPSLTGGYRIVCERLTSSENVHRLIMDIEGEIFARKDVQRLGIAPFSSMYWYGENSRTQAVDWRPEIHDSDGLAIWTGAGERIWRPLNNPHQVMTSTFVDQNPRGFGLLQRDRDFVHYLDDGVFYERRPSVWVEPLDGWGDGAVQLVEIPTDDEVHDNIVAYWTPEKPMKAGEQRRYRYRLSWLDDIPFPDSLGRATATWTGMGGRPGVKRPAGVRKFVIDFQGPVFDRLTRNDGVEIVVSVTRGTVTNAYSHPVVDQKGRWRALFDVNADGTAPVDMRAYLKLGNRALTETWIYQYFPEEVPTIAATAGVTSVK